MGNRSVGFDSLLLHFVFNFGMASGYGLPLLVRPGAARLLISIECSRVRDSTWMYITYSTVL